MGFLGSWKLEDYLAWSITTHVATTGGSQDADANPSFRVYEDNIGTPLTTGSLTKLDDANTTGLYHKRLQVTAASGFERGKSYNILNKATVNGVSGNLPHGFQVEAEVRINSQGYSPTVVVATNNDKTGYTSTVTGSVNLTSESVDAILDEVVEGTLTLRQVHRILLARLAGEATGGGTTTIVFKSVDGVTSRITMTVDASGNRSSVVLDGS